MKRKFFIKALALAVGFGMLVFPGPVQAGWHGFLRLEDAPGESQDPNHPGWMDVSSVMSANIETAPSAPGTIIPGVSNQRSLCFLKPLDTASPVLKLKCGLESRVPSGTLDLTADNTAAQILHLQMTNVYITSVIQSGAPSAGSPVNDQVCLQAEVMAWSYAQFNTNSGLASNYVSSVWSFTQRQGAPATNAPVFVITGIRQTTGVQLSWSAVGGQNYRIYAVDQLGVPFIPVAYQSVTNTGTMTIDLPVTNNVMFYVVENAP